MGDKDTKTPSKYGRYPPTTYFTYQSYYYPFGYYPYYESVYRGLHKTVYTPDRYYKPPK